METYQFEGSKTEVQGWIHKIQRDLIQPRAKAIQNHPFMLQMKEGTSRRQDAVNYFAGLMWHLLDFGKHVSHLMAKRPSGVTDLLVGRSEDKDGDTDILGRIVSEFGGPTERIQQDPWSYQPHRVWIHHDALLRSAIYSADLPWQVGTAALNVGIETLVPVMIQPLLEASIRNYGVTSHQAKWLESRAGEEEAQHGENGFIVLSHFLDFRDKPLVAQCEFYIDALSYSMAYQLLNSGLKGTS